MGDPHHERTKGLRHDPFVKRRGRYQANPKDDGIESTSTVDTLGPGLPEKSISVKGKSKEFPGSLGPVSDSNSRPGGKNQLPCPLRFVRQRNTFVLWTQVQVRNGEESTDHTCSGNEETLSQKNRCYVSIGVRKVFMTFLI